MRNPLPVIEVAEPCHEAWEQMAGDDRTRFCAHCKRHVHDLSAMTSDQVNDLICRSAGQLCVRFERTADGSARTLDYQKRTGGRFSVKQWISAGALAAIAAGAMNYLWHRPKPQPPPMVLGKMMMPVNPPTPSCPK